MRVLLINSWESEVFPTPAIGYLQAVLKEYDIDVIAKDLTPAMNDNNQYDIVGVTFHSFSVKFARQIREKFKNHLICGGHHPSAMPDQMLSIGYDQVVIGEGENAIIEIIEGNRSKVINSGTIKNYFIGINDLPFPDYSGLNYSGEMGIPIISSRGCTFECSFCASSLFWHRKYKMRTAENVLCEIEKRKSQGFSTWMFEDDNFTLNKKRAIEICQGLDDKYLWQCASRAESLDDDLCNELYRAGCRRIWLGIESFSQSSLERCKKNTTVDRMLSGIRMLEKYNINSMCQFIIGIPGDSINDINETIRVMKQNRIHGGGNILWVLPGTEAYLKAKERGFDDNIFLESGAPFYTYEQSIETLRHWTNLIQAA